MAVDPCLCREKCEHDRPGWFAGMTDEGGRRLAAVAPAHVESMRANFIGRLSDEEIEFLAQLMPRLARIEGD